MGKWPKRLAVFGIIVAAYFAVGEAFRAYARAELEKDMRANFEKLQCPPDQVQGDVCLAYPDEGRCISGEYIDYRTVWRRVHGRQEIVDLIGRQYDRLGRDKQKLANWFACQGFTRVRFRAVGEPTDRRASGISIATPYRFGYAAWTEESFPWPIRPILGVESAHGGLIFSEGGAITDFGLSKQRLLY